jgi:hypothetical protein
MTSNRVAVKEQDYLDQDPPLRGQNYVCLSFISPEDVINRKQDFLFGKFMGFFVSEMNEFFANLALKYQEEADIIRNIKERYPYVFDVSTIADEYNFFVGKNGEQLEKEYLEKNNFQTTIRGIKVRGTFETLKEAEVRAQVLKRMDDRFHVYVAEVGCWCPWSPNPDDIQNQEYAETELNTLMKGYKENQTKKDEFYHKRKDELAALKRKQIQVSDITATTQPETPSKLEDEDPWMARTNDKCLAPQDAAHEVNPCDPAEPLQASVETQP